MNNYPCKDCIERCFGCHSVCIKYKNAEIEIKKEKQLERQSKINDQIKFHSIFRGCEARDKKNIRA
ncbi:hypothetical protein [Clostridium butyricum]|uniref:Uncharacterized protein n=1 Tax=Clostridium butyricum E4 str. BoNT E BL5262 TaxID=632245 RepID=C4IHH6_CLOBU|nr:hypothetical protein [Clostridium butyricum]EEP54573.1 hypothetical protein CLP_2707 [Clostridium butyricum E4 str. BoNT E BL5262]NFL30575.1 hypothetical protein [Clostridium butyricum]NFS19530.1 hypothetical protein [Clostridium butyricum]